MKAAFWLFLRSYAMARGRAAVSLTKKAEQELVALGVWPARVPDSTERAS